MYFLPEGNATRYCIKGHIYPDFITDPLTCKRAELSWYKVKEHCQLFGKVLFEGPPGYETVEKRTKFCKELGLDGLVWEKKTDDYDFYSFICKGGECVRSGYPREAFYEDYFFCRD